MPGDFTARMDELMAQYTAGSFTATVEFDQVYAHRQHEELGWSHPEGGGAKYLERALFEGTPEYMEILAEGMINHPRIAMETVAEAIAKRASNNAPKRASLLEQSDHPTVRQGGVILYDRPPIVPRLTQQEIEAFNRALQNPNHWYGRWPRVIGEP